MWCCDIAGFKYTAISIKVVGKSARDNPKKVLWVALRALSFKEIWKNGTGGHRHNYVYEYSRKATKVGLTASVLSNSVLIISHISFQDCRMHISCANFLETAVYMYTLYTIHSVWLKGIIILVCVVPDALSQSYFLTYHLVRVTIC